MYIREDLGELVHRIMEAKKSHELASPSWRTRIACDVTQFTMQADSLLSEPPGKPTMSSTFCQSNFLKRKFFFTSLFLETLLVLFWDIRSPWSDLCIPLSILNFYFCCLYNSSDLEHPTLHLFMPFFLRIPLPVVSCLPCLPVKHVIHNFPSTRKLSLRELPILSSVLPNVLYCFRTHFF